MSVDTTAEGDTFHQRDSVRASLLSAPSEPSTTDSMVTVRLSEPVSAGSVTGDNARTSIKSDATAETAQSIRRRSSEEILHGLDLDPEIEDFEDEPVMVESPTLKSPTLSMKEPPMGVIAEGPSEEEEDVFADQETETLRSRSDSSASRHSEGSGTVNWPELERSEESEVKDGGTDESTAFLLARLEQENNALAGDPRFGLRRYRSRKQSRPPSIQVLKKLVKDPSNRASKIYSVLPSPPPMTELEFWAALVKDYPQTAQRLPTLTANKIKAGVPPPLRGVVWVSMVGARDAELAAQFDKLVEETSPYENLIGKDIGRSFPGVEMFKEVDGEGQQMLARVLKCFSLYDKEIGYCQGLGFIVGPLLMQMGDKDAFCVLVKLMENYDLRSCYLPNLSGLHLRIFQFQRLLTQHMPTLAAHLASMQVEAAYLSQWFLSFFAVTCPLPMLFRIYDVILAEGASETIMRVSLSLMRKNEKRIMASSEFEEVMQLLLGRSLWEPYNFNADELVNDFMDMTGLVSRERLQSLDAEFKATHGDNPGAWYTFLPDATSAASRFLGRLWTSHTPAKSQTLAPEAAVGGHSRTPSFLRRTASKQSIASTLNSVELSTDSANSAETVNTDPTITSQESSRDVMSMSSKSDFNSLVQPAVTKEDRDLHSQIEDLLTALSDMQREQSLMTQQIQKEREERSEDHSVFEELVRQMRASTSASSDQDRRKSMPYAAGLSASTKPPSELDEWFGKAEERFFAYREFRRSATIESKQRLRDSLIRNKDALSVEVSRSQELSRRLDEQERETTQARDALRETQSRLQDSMRDKQRLERQVQELSSSSRRSSVVWSTTSDKPPTLWRSDTTDSRMSISSLSGGGTSPGSPGINGLRELKLGRPGSLINDKDKDPVAPNLKPSSGHIPKRGSSLATQKILATEDHVPASEDALLVELVQAKTAEAIARQELEEVKGKLESMRKMLGMPSPSVLLSTTSGGTGHKPSSSESTVIDTNGSTTTPPATTSGGGFWSWGKRTTSNATTPPTTSK